MKDSQRFLVVLTAAALVAAALGYLAKDALLPPAAPRPAALSTVATAPAGSLVVLARDGARRDLASKTGKGLILHFWATWCPPCREEMPELVKFVGDTKSDAKVEVLPVSPGGDAAPLRDGRLSRDVVRRAVRRDRPARRGHDGLELPEVPGVRGGVQPRVWRAEGQLISSMRRGGRA